MTSVTNAPRGYLSPEEGVEVEADEGALGDRGLAEGDVDLATLGEEDDRV